MLSQGVFYSRSRSRSFGATWPMLIKLLTEARKGRENSSAKRDKYGGQRPAGSRQLRPEDGYLQLVHYTVLPSNIIAHVHYKPAEAYMQHGLAAVMYKCASDVLLVDYRKQEASELQHGKHVGRGVATGVQGRIWGRGACVWAPFGDGKNCTYF